MTKNKFCKWWKPSLEKIDMNRQIFHASLPILFTVIFIAVLARFFGIAAIGILVLGIICTLPVFIRSFTRIKKFWKMTMVEVPLMAILLGLYVPFTYSYTMTTMEPTMESMTITALSILFLLILIIPPIFLVVRWTRQWNENISDNTSKRVI